MFSDETKTKNAVLGSHVNTRVGRDAGPAVGTEAVARWARAVNAPPILRQPAPKAAAAFNTPTQSVSAQRPFAGGRASSEDSATSFQTLVEAHVMAARATPGSGHAPLEPAALSSGEAALPLPRDSAGLEPLQPPLEVRTSGMPLSKKSSDPEPATTLAHPPLPRVSDEFRKAPANQSSPFGIADPDTARTLPLSALRGLHASHRMGRQDAGEQDGIDGSRSARQQASSSSTAALLMPSAQALPVVELQATAEDVNPARGSDQLHALIESCCSRLWVSDASGHAPQGVMLDLGRWMPGCTVEVAKAAGMLRITLRGVDGSERSRFEEELQGLGADLAQKLGCQVVAAVAGNKELT